MISYGMAKARAMANRTDWNERTEITKAIITWLDSEYVYELEIENEDHMDNEEFKAWIKENAEDLAKGKMPRKTAQSLRKSQTSTLKKNTLTMMSFLKTNMRQPANLNGNAKRADNALPTLKTQPQQWGCVARTEDI